MFIEDAGLKLCQCFSLKPSCASLLLPRSLVCTGASCCELSVHLFCLCVCVCICLHPLSPPPVRLSASLSPGENAHLQLSLCVPLRVVLWAFPFDLLCNRIVWTCVIIKTVSFFIPRLLFILSAHPEPRVLFVSHNRPLLRHCLVPSRGFSFFTPPLNSWDSVVLIIFGEGLSSQWLCVSEGQLGLLINECFMGFFIIFYDCIYYNISSETNNSKLNYSKLLTLDALLQKQTGELIC